MPNNNYYERLKASVSEIHEESPYFANAYQLNRYAGLLNHEGYTELSTEEIERHLERLIAELNTDLVTFREENVTLSRFSDNDGQQSVEDYVAASNLLRLAEALAMTTFVAYRSYR